MGTQFPQNGHSLQFSAHSCCGQTARWIKMLLSREVEIGPGDIVLDRDPVPPKRHSPQLSAHVWCGHTAGWIKMPLGTKVGLGPCHIVLDGDPAPHPERGTATPYLFSARVYCGHGRPSQLLLSYCSVPILVKLIRCIYAATKTYKTTGEISQKYLNLLLELFVRFLANVNSRSHSLYAVARPSVVCLSVCNVHA